MLDDFKDLKEKYDVVILGASIASLSCFLFLKKLGVNNILVINKFSSKYHKACSGILTDRSIRLFNEIKVKCNNYKIVNNIEAFYNFNSFKKYDNSYVYAHMNTCLNRKSLDDEIFDICKENDIEIVENAINYRVIKKESKIVLGNKKITYNYLVDGSGFSQIANKTKNKIIGIEYRLSDFTNINKNNSINVEIHLFNKIKGYGWVVKSNDIPYTIGLTDKYVSSKNYKNLLIEFAKNANINITKKDLLLPNRLSGAFIPSKPIKYRVNKNIIYIGDRAGLNDALTQEGICYALLSAKYAAESIKTKKVSLYNKKLNNVIKSLNRANLLRKPFFLLSNQEKIWTSVSKHQFPSYVFHLFCSIDNFSYCDLIKYRKQFKGKSK